MIKNGRCKSLRFGIALSFVLALAAPARAQSAAEWEIGPIIRGKNYSVGLPSHPTPKGKGWYFDFPYPSETQGHVHYVTVRRGSLVGKSKIVVRYRIDAAPEVKFIPREFPHRTATITLYFQRKNDSWTARGRYNFFRWFAATSTMQSVAPGLYELTVRLDAPNWGSVMGQQSGLHPAEFRAALSEADRVGLLFGSRGGRGHGVFATGPARFTMLSFNVL